MLTPNLTLNHRCDWQTFENLKTPLHPRHISNIDGMESTAQIAENADRKTKGGIWNCTEDSGAITDLRAPNVCFEQPCQ
ncbi:hypothetical protein PM082_002270 [Marasmius tenuissimus]|nr:hypothetical protein PM082_002270 [Marasmius tenuissimus]